MTDQAVQKKIDEMSFEEALAALEKIVTALEGGRIDLERSIDLYEHGAALRARCEAKLQAAEMRVEQIMRGADGEASGASPMDGSGA